MKKTVRALLMSSAMVAGASTAEAAGISINYDTFGTLAGATFGGSGIPNDAVAISTFAGIGDDVITIGLTAHERFVAPVVTTDGAGTFYAEPGTADPDGGGPSPNGALWNVGFYISVANGNLGDYDFDLLYEFDAGSGTDVSQFGALDINAAIVFLGGNPATLSLAQDSQNLLFAFLSSPSSFVTPPTGSFNPFAAGEYTLALRTTVVGSTAGPLDITAIEVEVVPEPATLTMLLLGGAAGLAKVRRRKRT
jgi:hypothetical protein